ncbi:MAG: hypothetical protein E6G53_10270 [Actinobacteria bacterium]|nr:MAG: hypothetical protein E6G53_10270 [Actinomycetota bacterium]
MLRRRFVVALGVSALAAVAGAAPASGSAPTTLRHLGQATSWGGSISNAVSPRPETCTEFTCNTYDVAVGVAPGTWRPPGGLLVSLKWPDAQLDAFYDLDVYVYGPDGKLAARSNNVTYSSAEGAWVQNPKNGRYRIVVVPRDVIGTSPYRLRAALKRGWTVHTPQTSQVADPTGTGTLPYTPDFTFLGTRPRHPKALLPDLAPDKPKNFHIESAVGGTFYQSMDRNLRHQPSCYAQETTGADADRPGDQQPGALRCLRFDQSLINRGRGPFEIRAYPNNGNGTDAWQVVYRTDGTYFGRKAGEAVFSNAHGHIHYRHFDDTGLYTVGPHGRPGKLVKAMVDKGRCAVDTTDVAFGTPREGPAHYYVPSTCDQNDNQDPRDPAYKNASYFRSAISPGWADTYPWFIPDSYIDITHVPDGRYIIVDRINEAGHVLESSRSNNTSMACVEFHGTTVSGCPTLSGG